MNTLIRIKSFRWLVSGVALALLAAACQTNPQATLEEAPAQSVPQVPIEAPTNVPEAVVDPTEVASSPQVQDSPVEVRQGLAATDPATVSLANGSPTLVEFFAFW